MKCWRSKLLFILIVYFAGFATGVYVLVPGSYDLAEEQGRPNPPKSLTDSILKSDDFGQRFRTGMDKCVDFGRDASSKVGELLRKKYSVRSEQSDG